MELTANRRHLTKVVLAAGGLLASATALAFGIGAVLDRPATLMAPSDYRAMKAAIEVDSNVALDKCLILEGTAFARMHRHGARGRAHAARATGGAISRDRRRGRERPASQCRGRL